MGDIRERSARGLSELLTFASPQLLSADYASLRMTDCPMTHDPDLLAVAKRVVWFQPPEETLGDTTLFLNHVMTYGTVPDVLTVREHFDDQALRDALRDAYPGVFDARSWAYWHTVLGMTPVPELPIRKIPGTEGMKPVPWPFRRRDDADSGTEEEGSRG